MESKSRKLVDNFIVFTLGSFGSKILVFLLLPLYTSILTTSEYGTIDLITTTTMLLYPIVTLGLNDAIFRFIMSKSYSNDDVIRVGIRVPCVIYCATLIIASIINIYIKWDYMGMMLLLLLSQMLYELALNYTKAIGKSKTYAFVGIFQTSLLLILNILLLKIFSFGILGYIIANCVSYSIPGLFVIIKYHLLPQTVKNTNSDTNNSTCKEMLRYSVPLIFNTLSWLVIMSSDRYMIRLMIDVDSVGIYSIAAKIPTILQTLITIFTTVWEISSNDIYENDYKLLPDFYEKGMKYYSTVGYCGGSLLLLLCPYLMRILARGDFYQGWVYAPFLIVSVVFSTAGGMNGAIYAAFKDNKGAFLSSLSGAIINLILNYFGIKFLGIVGATISTAISRLYISVYRTKDTEKFLLFNRSYGIIVICSVLIVFQSVLLTKASYLRNGLQMMCVILMFTINRKSIREMLHLFASLISKRGTKNA